MSEIEKAIALDVMQKPTESEYYEHNKKVAELAEMLRVFYEMDYEFDEMAEKLIEMGWDKSL